jgi:hypothetical protein
MKKTPDTPTILTVIKSAQPVTPQGQIEKFGDRRIGDFAISLGQIYFIKRGQDHKDGKLNELPTPLTDNFVALIVEEIIFDDGAQLETAFMIEGKHKTGSLLPQLTITTTQYMAMQWPLKHWGARAIVEADQATPRRLANAILKLSGDIPITTIHQYTGWRLFEQEWQFLSNSGALGAEGLNPEIRVDLGNGNMSRYSLPAPAEEPRQIAGAFFNLLTIAPTNKAVGVSLLCCAVRAVLGECLPIDFSLFFFGQTGSYKSESVALIQAFFGDFNARAFPANYTDTDSDLECKAHQAKDTVLVVDDFSPSVSQVETNKLHSKAERLFRGAGNQAGRGRRNADMTGKAAYYPRCLLVTTGEDLPKGASLLGRLLIIELKKGDVDLSYLTSLQHQARKGEFSACMAAFLKWLAPRMPDLKLNFPGTVRKYRTEARDSKEKFATSHSRAADIYTSLFAAVNLYIDFAYECKAINEIRATDLATDIDNTLKDAIRAQCDFQKQADEVERFISLLQACFSSGECHVGDYLNQGPPVQKDFLWGWRTPSQGADLAGYGQFIGWINQAKGDLYLVPETVQRFANAQNDPLLMQKTTLYKALMDRGLVEFSIEQKRKRYAPKRTVAGASKRVLVFRASIIETESDGDDEG